MKQENFLKFCKRLISFGFNVHISYYDPSECLTAIFTDGTHIGRMEPAGFGLEGVRLSTIHKPCRDYGCGFACQDIHDYVTIDEMTKEKAREAFSVVPESFGPVDTSLIKKYNDFEDWKKHSATAKYYKTDSSIY